MSSQCVWSTGFVADVAVRNNRASRLDGWTVRWTFADGQAVTNLWNGAHTSNGPAVTVRNAAHNGRLDSGASTSFGFVASSTGTNSIPTVLTCTSS